MRHMLVSVFLLLAATGSSNAVSPYAGQDSQSVKSLSPEEISDFLSGKGMGLAKAAELNGYPGPAHVLELAAKLELTTEQRTKTEMLFRDMKTNAVALGKELVKEERALDHLFSTRAVTSATLAGALARISKLRGEIRRVHLDTHLRQTALLEPAQIEEYMELRGYDATNRHGHSSQKQH